MKIELEWLIRLGGLCHLGLMVAGPMAVKQLGWKHELKHISPMSRHMIWAHGTFIVMTIAFFAAVSLVSAPLLVSGHLLARWLCGFVAVFWGARLVVQLFMFDARPHLTSAFLKLGYHALTVVFAYLTAVYAWAALRGLL